MGLSGAYLEMKQRKGFDKAVFHRVCLKLPYIHYLSYQIWCHFVMVEHLSVSPFPSFNCWV